MRGPLTWLGRWLADYLSQERPRGELVSLADPAVLAATLRPCDVLLVEGNTRFSVAIKYLTQSTWSHAALYVGSALGRAPHGGENRVFIEADVREGVRAVPLSEYASMHTRICRPAGIAEGDAAAVIAYAVAHLGDQYDLRNVIDLARYLLPTPPVPARFRRRIIAFGSGESDTRDLLDADRAGVPVGAFPDSAGGVAREDGRSGLRQLLRGYSADPPP